MKIKARHAITLGLAAALLAGGSTPATAARPRSADAAVPPAGSVTITSMTFSGAGCGTGTAAASLNPDNTTIEVMGAEFRGSVGAGAKVADQRRNCQLSLSLAVPQGYTYALSGADYTVYGALASGATAAVRISAYFQGSASTVAMQHSFTGPFNDFISYADTIPPATQVFATCGVNRALNINTETRAGLGSSDRALNSFLAYGLGDGTAPTTYHLAWKSC